MTIPLPYDSGIYKPTYSNCKCRFQRKFGFFKKIDKTLLVFGFYTIFTKYHDDGTVASVEYSFN